MNKNIKQKSDNENIRKPSLDTLKASLIEMQEMRIGNLEKKYVDRANKAW